jgi:hypothetical protein
MLVKGGPRALGASDSIMDDGDWLHRREPEQRMTESAAIHKAG